MEVTWTLVDNGSDVSIAVSLGSLRHCRVRRLRSSAYTFTPSASAIAEKGNASVSS